MNRLFSSSSAPKTMASQLRKVSHVIFDMDGLLLDTERLYTVATQNILDNYGKTYTWEVKSAIMGMQSNEMAQYLVDAYELPMTPDEYLELAKEQYAQLMPTAALMEGAEKLVRHLHSHKIPICLATSSGEAHVKVKTQHHQELFSLFHHKVMGSTDPDVKNGKPAPDIFLIAASRFPDKPDPADCLVFEDAPNGVKAAKAAGMQVVMVPDHRVGQEERAEATVAVNSLLEVDLEAFGLPPLPK